MLNFKDIKNIVFDLGGVILDLDVPKSIAGFNDIGFRHLSFEKIALSAYPFFKDYETGMITTELFRDELRKLASKPLEDHEIDEVWNAMVVGFNPAKIELLQRLKKKYRTFLLSNTNAMHEACYNDLLRRSTGIENLRDLFEKVYYSHRVHMRKPDREIFEHVLKDAGLLPGETLYIDDLKIHVDGAAALGIRAYHLKEEDSLVDLFASVAAG